MVGFPHNIKGEGIYCYVVLKEEVEADASLEKDLRSLVRERIGPIASPVVLHFTADLPKTRSGKIMRRILRKVAAGENNCKAMGDTSTLADPAVVERLINSKRLHRPTTL